ncbi:MAG: Lrp/AsnC family transcriptional regulator [Chitinophagaceae bacterium]|nr:Lrp/AsnC family transcriptional regulator [Chitinophagaceae bacterium]
MFDLFKAMRLIQGVFTRIKLLALPLFIALDFMFFLPVCLTFNVIMAKELLNKGLDGFHWKIIQELQMNARITVVEIGKRIGLSAPAVAERIKKLEEEGYIKGYRTIVDYDKLGLSVPVFIHYKATKISHADMIKMVDQMPEVVEWYGITGAHCSMLKVIVASTKELENVIEKLQEFGETSTSIILSGNSAPKIIRKK